MTLIPFLILLAGILAFASMFPRLANWPVLAFAVVLLAVAMYFGPK